MPPLSPLFCENFILRDSECSLEASTRSSLLLAEHTALLICDVQQANWHAAKKEFPSFPRNLERTIANCRKENAKIVWVKQGNGDTQNSQRALFKGKLENFHSNSASSELEVLPRPQNYDLVVNKKGLSGTTNTRLLSQLEEANIDTVLVCGLFTSLCVQHTAFKIFEAGFRTILVEDACGDQSQKRHEAALSLYGNYMYEMVHSQDLEPNRGNMWKRSRFHNTVAFVPSKPSCDNASDTSSVTNATELSTSHSDSSDDDDHHHHLILIEDHSIPKATAGASKVLSTITMMTSVVIGAALAGSLLKSRSPLCCQI